MIGVFRMSSAKVAPIISELLWLLYHVCHVSAFHVLLPTAQRRLIGTLPNLQHRISGTLYAEGDCKFVIEGFGYDGLGPDAFIYVYEKGATLSRFGGGLIIKLSGTR